jgi:NitT/TauT family transport system ATP-binding protein
VNDHAPQGLIISDLAKVYPARGQEEPLEVFSGLDCLVEPGSLVTLVGPSGCGKTTLLRVIAGLEPPSAGLIRLTDQQGPPVPGQVGLVFQNYALMPWRTVLGNIALGLEFAGVPKDQRRQAARAYVRAFGLEGFEKSYPGQLSGGMQQRVAIARTLAASPRLVLMDEPFGSLDSQTRNSLQEFLLNLWQERGDTIIFVTHNVDEAVFLSSEILVLSKRPARILRRIPVDLPRPRDRTSPEANTLRRQVLEVLREERG